MAMTALDYEGIRQLLARYSVARGEGLAVPSADRSHISAMRAKKHVT
ncbi:hypothetical protein [Streptosporangium subroseum]|nr:hypothetical protein OHB15_02910 [Streptosporangium subroseum]